MSDKLYFNVKLQFDKDIVNETIHKNAKLLKN